VQSVRFFLDISSERYLAYYQGAAQKVIATGSDGRRIAFPASRLRPFVTLDGVRGEFLLRYDHEHRFHSLERIGDLPRRA